MIILLWQSSLISADVWGILLFRRTFLVYSQLFFHGCHFGSIRMQFLQGLLWVRMSFFNLEGSGTPQEYKSSAGSKLTTVCSLSNCDHWSLFLLNCRIRSRRILLWLHSRAQGGSVENGNLEIRKSWFKPCGSAVVHINTFFFLLYILFVISRDGNMAIICLTSMIKLHLASWNKGYHCYTGENHEDLFFVCLGFFFLLGDFFVVFLLVVMLFFFFS